MLVNINAIIDKLIEGGSLNKSEAYELMCNIADANINNSQLAALLTIYRIRILTSDEINGFRNALLEHSVNIDLSDYNTIDIVGTGGDGKNTFNISTSSCFVVAAAGYKVSKHGSYSASSTSGASNALEFLGHKFTSDEDKLKKQLDTAGICFMHAPLFHPALKNVVTVRKELAVKTIFNIMGPLINPSQPKNNMLGVSSLEVMDMYNSVFCEQDKNYSLVYSTDGYDEISLTSNAVILSNNTKKELKPSDFGMSTYKQEQLFGGDTIKDAAQILLNVMQDKATEAQKNVVIANAAAGIQCISQKPLKQCVSEARQAIESKKAYDTFKLFMDCN